MQKILSIIIPTYNSIRTIKRCLDSIVSQITETDYEVIIVDDGSTDGTATFVDDYIKNIQGFHLAHQANAGAGAARNHGLTIACGEYVLFVDSDDYLRQDALNIIASELKENSLEILIFAYRYYDDSCYKFKEMYSSDSKIYSNEKIKGKIFEFKDYPIIHECIAYPWNKVFRKSLLINNHIRCSETRVQNDVFINIASLCSAKKIKIIPDLLYVHEINSTTGTNLEKFFDNRRLDALIAFKECEDFFEKINLDESLRLSYYVFKLKTLSWIIQKSVNDLRRKFLDNLEDFCLSLPSETIFKILDYPTLSPWVKDFIKGNILFKRGEISFDSPLYQSLENNLLISIIVPIYNVELYLEQCLSSLVNQTLSPKHFEVILVDDKSTDGSLSICRKFCQKYSNFKLIELPKNTPGGAGIPSNRGIDAAKGLYIGFVDGDDYILPGMFEELLMKALETKADLVLCDFSLYQQQQNLITGSYDKNWKPFIKEDLLTLSNQELKHRVLRLNPVPWRKIYKRAFLEQYHIRYPEGDFFYEDNPLHWFSVILAESFAFVDKRLIVQRIGRVGQTTEYKNDDKLLAYVSLGKIIKEFLVSNGLFEEYRVDFVRWVLRVSSIALPRLKSKKAFITGVSTLLADTTWDDLQRCREITHQRRADLIFNFCLVHGYYRTGKVIRWLLLNRNRLPGLGRFT